MKIKRNQYISNEEVLARANVEDIELKLVISRPLYWLGHASRMEDHERPAKAQLYGELDNGKRPTGRPKLRYKYTWKSGLKCGKVIKEWRWKVDNQVKWRQLIFQTCEKVNEKRI